MRRIATMTSKQCLDWTLFSKLSDGKELVRKLKNKVPSDVIIQNVRNGKIFLYAKILKDNNEKIRDLILENAHLLPSEQQSHAIKLVSHIDIWILLWEDTNEKLSPILTDIFSFKNDATFPTESESSLMSYYSLIKNN